MRPHIIINVAMSIDGKIALTAGKQTKLSSEEDMVRVHKLRNDVDAILVGIGTILSDDPKLTVKKQYVDFPKSLTKIVLDSKLRTPENAEVFNYPGKVIIATTENSIGNINAEIIKCGTDEVDIPKLLEILYERGIKKILVEGGGKVIYSFLKKDVVDELKIYVAPIIIGGNAPSIVEGKGADEMGKIIPLKLDCMKKLGDGILLEYTKRNA